MQTIVSKRIGADFSPALPHHRICETASGGSIGLQRRIAKAVQFLKCLSQMTGTRPALKGNRGASFVTSTSQLFTL